MNQISPNIRLFTYQESQAAGLQIRCLVLNHNSNNYHLEGGTSDTIYVFTESICLYVLTINKRLGYLGLNAYMVPECDPINSFFLHSNRDICEYLGKNWEVMKPETIVKRLIEYLY
jgi:hypothetical protein